MIDPVTESDLAAYVDGELGSRRRLEVEGHLAQHPEDAARVMADLRDRDALREIYAVLPGAGPERLRATARRIDRSMAWQRVGARLRRAAAIVLLVGAGWLAHTEIGTFGVPDTYASTIDASLAEEAHQARQAVLIRAKTHSQPPVSSYDRADLEDATGLSLPKLPNGWSVRDVQVFPSRRGPGVEIAINAGALGDLSLFATRQSENRAASDGLSRSADGATTYWQAGRTAYALTGGSEGVDLSAAAAKLAAR